jgi:hypothetical protein
MDIEKEKKKILSIRKMITHLSSIKFGMGLLIGRKNDPSHDVQCSVLSCYTSKIIIRTNGLHYCYNLTPPCRTDRTNFFRSLFNSANSMRIQLNDNIMNVHQVLFTVYLPFLVNTLILTNVFDWNTAPCHNRKETLHFRAQFPSEVVAITKVYLS